MPTDQDVFAAAASAAAGLLTQRRELRAKLMRQVEDLDAEIAQYETVVKLGTAKPAPAKRVGKTARKSARREKAAEFTNSWSAIMDAFKRGPASGMSKTEVGEALAKFGKPVPESEIEQNIMAGKQRKKLTRFGPRWKLNTEPNGAPKEIPAHMLNTSHIAA